MNKIAVISLVLLVIILTGISGCGGGNATNQPENSVKPVVTATQNQNTAAIKETAVSGAGATALRNENWLIGTWSATVPQTETSFFKGKKIQLKIASVKLISNEKIQGNPAGKYGFSGNLVWDEGGKQRMPGLGEADSYDGESVLVWGYTSPGANQFMENISLRVYDGEWSFELDWGPQISKQGNSYSSLPFFGSIHNLETSETDFFDPESYIKFSQSSKEVPVISSAKPEATRQETEETDEIAESDEPAAASTKTTAPQAAGSLWNDIPVYPGAKIQEDGGLGEEMSDESYARIEWKNYASHDNLANVAKFFQKEMVTKGWQKQAWLDQEEMAYGAFFKDNENRACIINITADEELTYINIMSASK